MMPSAHRANRTHARGGMASLLAISLLVLIASVLVALGTMAGADLRRSRDLQTDAQLRQLLTAGAIQAGQILNRGSAPTHAVSVDVPAELHSSGAKVELSFKGDDHQAQVEIRASLGRHSSSQSLEFTKSTSAGGKWTIASATLDGQ